MATYDDPMFRHDLNMSPGEKFQCSACGGFHTSHLQCPKQKVPIGKVTGFKPEPIPIVEVSLATASRYGGGRDYEFEFPKIEVLKDAAHRLNVAEAQAMERARMLGMKIVVDPKLRGSETEIHVSQERYDLLQQIIEEKKT